MVIQRVQRKELESFFELQSGSENHRLSMLGAQAPTCRSCRADETGHRGAPAYEPRTPRGSSEA